ncbi:MAG: hypothetical protein OEV15_04115 [Gallionella sp.]|nr:hypothetical protein [Gallionella sp.]
MTRRCEASGAGMASSHPLPQTAGFDITSDLASVVCSPSRMASSFTSNVPQDVGYAHHVGRALHSHSTRPPKYGSQAAG